MAKKKQLLTPAKKMALKKATKASADARRKKSASSQDLENRARGYAERYRDSPGDATALRQLKSLLPHTLKGGALAHLHPGDVPVYRGGTSTGVSWSKLRKVAMGFRRLKEVTRAGEFVYGPLHQGKVDRKTPALDMVKLLPGSKFGKEREVFVVGKAVKRKKV